MQYMALLNGSAEDATQPGTPEWDAEMAAYGAVRTYARRLQLDEQADILQTEARAEGRTDDLDRQVRLPRGPNRLGG